MEAKYKVGQYLSDGKSVIRIISLSRHSENCYQDSNGAYWTERHLDTFFKEISPEDVEEILKYRIKNAKAELSYISDLKQTKAEQEIVDSFCESLRTGGNFKVDRYKANIILKNIKKGDK